MKKKWLCAVLPMVLMTAVLAGCGKNNQNGMPNTSAGSAGGGQIVTDADLGEEQKISIQNEYMNFSWNLLSKTSEVDGNAMVSPFSVSVALNMLAQGAEGETYNELASLLGPNASKEELATYAAGRIQEISSDKEIHIANSLWVDDNHLKAYNTTLNKNFIKTLDKSFGIETDIHSFSPDVTTGKINDWVKKNTSGMIDRIIEPDAIDADSFAYIINAIAFEKKWVSPFEGMQVDANGTFTNSKGEKETVKMMNDTEYMYYENELATGFVKPYEGGIYGFMAILPKDEKESINDFLAEFNGVQYESFASSKSLESVWIKMPAFTYEYEKELNGVLMDMGMNKAFNPDEADLSGMLENGEPNFYVSRVLHKTFIDVNETGTKAAAVTSIEVKDEGAFFVEDEPKEVVLDRPFVYAIVDLDTYEPLFIGMLNHVN